MPLYLVTILCYWYKHQVMFVRWGLSLSTDFRVTNRVRQGSVLSPLLFNVYINNLSIRRSETGIGGFIGGKFVNHMIYADVHLKKSVCMFFRSSVNKLCGLSDIFISGTICEFLLK